jgi:hypothetical protein
MTTTTPQPPDRQYGTQEFDRRAHPANCGFPLISRAPNGPDSLEGRVFTVEAREGFRLVAYVLKRLNRAIPTTIGIPTNASPGPGRGILLAAPVRNWFWHDRLDVGCLDVDLQSDRNGKALWLGS